MKWVVSIVFALIILINTGQSFAQESPLEISPTLTPTPSPIEYQLPYPGLLPDNPLYSIKALRDRIIDFLISDPLKKSEFYLLQADKRLQAGVALLEKGNADLADSTISKGENYFEEAILQIKKAKEEGVDVAGFLGRLITSSQKHQEVLIILEKKAPPNLKKNFQNLGKRASEFEKDVKNISKK